MEASLPFVIQLSAGIIFILFGFVGGVFVVLRALWKRKFEILFALLPAEIEISFKERHFIKAQIFGHPLSKDFRIRHPLLFLLLSLYLEPRRLVKIIFSTFGIVLVLVVFFSIVGTVITSSPIIENFDLKLTHILLSSRLDIVSIGMAIFTIFGEWYLLGLFGLILTIFWWERKKRIAIIPFWFTYFGTLVSVQVIKLIVGRGRPIFELSLIEHGFSFPSAHASLSMAVFGFLIYLLTKKYGEIGLALFRKNLHITLLSLLILIIGVSRVYMGVHFPSDIIFGWLVGLFMLVFGIVIYEGLKHYLER